MRCPPNGLAISVTAMGSWIKSESPTRITAFSVADSFKPSSAGGSFFSSGVASSGFFSGAFGLPSGKAVLNFPASRMASGYSVPDGLKLLRISSPLICASIGSTSCEFADDFTSTVSFKPSAGVPENAPAKTSARLSMSAVSTSSLFTAFSVSVSTAGMRPCWRRVTYSVSATTFVVSKVRPHALSNLSSDELLGIPPIGPAACRSSTESGSRKAMSLPPRRTN